MCKREKKESVNWKVKERKGNLPVSVSSPVTAILCVRVFTPRFFKRQCLLQSLLWLKCCHSQQPVYVCNLQLEALTSAWHHWPPDVNSMLCSLTELWVRGSGVCLWGGIIFSMTAACLWVWLVVNGYVQNVKKTTTTQKWTKNKNHFFKSKPLVVLQKHPHQTYVLNNS